MTRGVRVQSAATAAGRAARRPLLPGGRAAVPPADAAADAGGGAHRELGAPFRIRAGTDIEAAEYADGVVVTTPPRLGVRLPARDPVSRRALASCRACAELCDRPVTVEESGAAPPLLSCETGWPGGRVARDADAARGPADAIGLRDRRPGWSATSSVMRRPRDVAIGDLSVRRSSTHLAQRSSIARTYRFTAPCSRSTPPTGRLARARRSAGYYDQAHFGHEFRTFTGLTPTRYLDVRRRFLREHPGHALDVGPLPAD